MPPSPVNRRRRCSTQPANAGQPSMRIRTTATEAVLVPERHGPGAVMSTSSIHFQSTAGSTSRLDAARPTGLRLVCLWGCPCPRQGARLGQGAAALIEETGDGTLASGVTGSRPRTPRSRLPSPPSAGRCFLDGGRRVTLDSAAGRAVLGDVVVQKGEHGGDPPVDERLGGQAELAEDPVDLLLDRGLRQAQLGGDPAIPRPWAISRRTSSSRGLGATKGDSRRRAWRATSASTTCRGRSRSRPGGPPAARRAVAPPPPPGP